MATGTALSRAFPLGSRLNERGRLEVGGCDTIELAREFGTPAYVVAEDDLRAARARVPRRRPRRPATRDLQVVFASKAFPCTAVLALFAAGGAVVRRRLRRRAAPGAGRRLRAGADRDARQRQVRGGAAHGAAPPRRRDRDRQPRRDRAAGARSSREGALGDGRGGPSRCCCGSTPDVSGETHEKISTGQADSKFGFSMAEAPAAIERVARDRRASSCRACTRTSARSCSSSSRSAARPPSCARARRVPRVGPRRRPRRALHRGAARAAGDRGLRRRDRRRRRAPTALGAPARLLIEPGSALVRERRRDALHGRGRQAERLTLGRGRRRHVRQPAPDALRRRLRGARGRPLRRLAPSACSRASTASPAT